MRGPSSFRGLQHDGPVPQAVSVRAPLRISLGGGGTDLPSHYRNHGGFVLSAAIDRYVRVRVSEPSGPRFRLDHLRLEEVDDPAEVEHPILRAALARHHNGRPLDLVSVGDVAPGTGLGSSGAYTVCCVHALELALGHTLSDRSRRSRVRHRAGRCRPHRRQAGPVRGRPRRRERDDLQP